MNRNVRDTFGADPDDHFVVSARSLTGLALASFVIGFVTGLVVVLLPGWLA